MTDYGNRDWEQPCICGHSIMKHTSGRWPGCDACFVAGNPLQDYGHEFKLDNLALVEQVARAKGLI